MKCKSVIDPSDSDFGAVCICAVRYALGRETYMPLLVQGFIRPLLPHFSDKDLAVLERDVAEADKWGGYGDINTDKPDWMRFLAAIRAEQNIRRNPM